MNYHSLSEFFDNPSVYDGWLTSDILDLRKSVLGTSSPVGLELSGATPDDTLLQLQYRIGNDLDLFDTLNWLPVGPQNSSLFLQVGNHSLMHIGQENSFIQYRIKFSTTELNNWNIPNLDFVKIYYEDSTLLGQHPSSLHPNAAPINLTTLHSSFAANSSYSLLLHPTNSDGVPLQNSHPANITWHAETETFAIDEYDGLWKMRDINVVQL